MNRVWRIVVVGAVAILSAPSWAQDRDLAVRLPAQAFGELPHPAAPAYDDLRFWAAHPAKQDAADLTPQGDRYGDRQARAAVDVFYIHPTTYRGVEYWNQPLEDEVVNRWTDESVIARQAAIFNACCRVFAPRYRQASAAAVYAPPELKPLEAYEFAWQDVQAAFERYMQLENRGRPFMLVGHSQGAAHLERWLRDYPIEHPYRRQLVAIYAVGVTFSAQVLQQQYGMAVCAEPESTGCLLSWNTFDRAGDPSAYRTGAQKRNAQRFAVPPDAPLVCINPLSFSLARPAVAAEDNPGSLPAGDSSMSLPATVPSVLGADCSEGVLRVDSPPEVGYAIVRLPGGMLHFNDFDLFFDSIRKNAVLRADRFRVGSAERSTTP